jgi:hypothetical protein
MNNIEKIRALAKSRGTNSEKKTIDYKERAKLEYVDRRFKGMISTFSASINKKFKAREFAASLIGMEEDNIPPARPFPYLDLAKIDRQASTQEQLRMIRRTIMENEGLKTDSVIDQPFMYINFCYRDQLYPHKALLSQRIIEIGLLGDMQRAFDSSEDDLMEAVLVAGNVGEVKQALLCAVLEDGKEYIFELEDFLMVSLTEKYENREKGIFTVFSKKLGILYNEFIEGSPDLRYAKIPLTITDTNNTKDNDETETTDTDNTD